MHDRLHVGARAIDFAVDEALQIHASPGRIERHAVEVEGDDVLAADQARRHVARQQKMIGRLVVASADMSEAVDDALPVKDTVGENELVD